MNFKYFIFNILLVICISLLIMKCLIFLTNTLNSNLTGYTLKDNIRGSSVWCMGSDHSQRRCRFENLCYKTDTNDYIFLWDENVSIKSGIPSDRFSPALLDLSSVRNHNQFYFNYIEIPLNILVHNLSQKYEIKVLNEKTFIMSRFKADNLMHYFHDDLIPLYFTLEEIGDKQISSIFLNDIYGQQFHLPFDKNTFDFVFPKSILRSDLNDKTIYCFNESFVGLSKAMTWYDYGFRSPQSPINRSKEESQLISKTVRKLTNNLLLKVSKKCNDRYVVFISRKYNRKIVNEKPLIDLISNYTKLRVVVIDDLSHNLELIIEKVFCAQLLVAIHGSALILSMFLRPGSSVIELFPYAINPHHLTPYKTLTQLNGININYFYWRNQFIQNTITHEEYPQELGGILHLSPEERRIITSNTDEVPKQLCCSDKYWLYRIYQDTIVDINSFKDVLSQAYHKSLEPVVETKYMIEPGVVMHLNCHQMLMNNTNTVVINWQKPWNLHYMDIDLQFDIKYEILIQEVPSLSAKSLSTENNKFSFVSKPHNTYNVWIRCLVNGINGPFNTKALIC